MPHKKNGNRVLRELRKIRNKHYEETKNISMTERMEYYHKKSESFRARLEQYRKKKNNEKGS